MVTQETLEDVLRSRSTLAEHLGRGGRADPDDIICGRLSHTGFFEVARKGEQRSTTCSLDEERELRRD